VYAAARAGAVHLDGQNIFIYRAAIADEVTVDFCVGVTAPFAAVGPVEPFQTPPGVAAMTTHVGDYGQRGETNAAILTWCRPNSRLPAVRRGKCTDIGTLIPQSCAPKSITCCSQSAPRRDPSRRVFVEVGTRVAHCHPESSRRTA
jgi:hypothetical protein